MVLWETSDAGSKTENQKLAGVNNSHLLEQKRIGIGFVWVA